MKRTLTKKLGTLGFAALSMLALSGPMFTATVRADDAAKPPLTDEEKRRFLERLKGSLSTGVDMRIPPLTIRPSPPQPSRFARPPMLRRIRRPLPQRVIAEFASTVE